MVVSQYTPVLNNRQVGQPRCKHKQTGFGCKPLGKHSQVVGSDMGLVRGRNCPCSES